jgi:hypothetical protein
VAVLCGGATFIVIQLGLTLVMEGWLPQLRDPNYAFKAARLEQRIRAAKARGNPARVVVMLGSSQVDYGLRGALVEESLSAAAGQPVILFNLGIPNDGPLNELLNLERLLADNVRPDLVLIEVLPALLAEHANRHIDGIPAERLGLGDRAILRRHQFPVSRLPRYSWLCWAVPCYAHRQEMLSCVLPHLLPANLRQNRARRCDRSGWIAAPEAHDLEAHQQIARQMMLSKYHAWLEGFRLGSELVPLLRQVLQKCRQEHIRAALVLMPEAQPFQQLYSVEAWKQISAFLEELSTRYQAPLINARDWVADEDFLDYQHLLPQGAAVFTERLAHEHLVPLLGSLKKKRANHRVTEGTEEDTERQKTE